jgi:tryptophan-rich sensory protein
MSKTFRFRTWHAAAFLAGIGALSAASSTHDARRYWRGGKRSSKAPPPWVFPSVWTALNVLQLWADLRILNDRESPDRNALVGLRAASWLLSAIFTPTLFRSRALAGAEAATLAEGVATGAAVALLAKRDPLAAAALTPIALWTAYASLNSDEAGVSNPDKLVDRLRWEGAF